MPLAYMYKTIRNLRSFTSSFISFFNIVGVVVDCGYANAFCAGRFAQKLCVIETFFVRISLAIMCILLYICSVHSLAVVIVFCE
jgi:hypothetical protein